MEKYGRIEEKALHIQNQSYKVVIIPKISVISRSVYNLLLSFVDEGRIILGHQAIKDNGLLIDAENDEAADLLLQKIIFYSDEKAIAENLSTYVNPMLIVHSGSENISDFQNHVQDILYTKRGYKGEKNPFKAAYYLVNLSKESLYKVDIYLQAENVCLYDPLTGEYSQLDNSQSNGFLKTSLNFSGMGQFVLITDYNSAIDFSTSYSIDEGKKDIIDLDGISEIEPLELNSLTLDTCTFYFDGKLEAENESVSVILDRILVRKKRTALKMEFFIESDKDFSTEEELYFVLENPETFSIELNGKSVINTDCGFYRDFPSSTGK